MKKEIICTLGPSSMNKRVITRLQDIGVSLFRINLSHTKSSDFIKVARFIKDHTPVPICIDTEGAQIRTGYLKNKKVVLKENSTALIKRRVIMGDSREFNLYPSGIIDEFRVGDFISIDFNSVLAQVIGKRAGGLTVRILVGGLMGQNKAVSLERDMIMPALTTKDRLALSQGRKMGIGHIAVSFASQAADVEEARSISGRNAFIISKIESIKGLVNLEEIAAKSDALLIDRGDLSRQIAVERIPLVQKDIIRRVKKMNKRIYVATNLLESMTSSNVPTRAEVNDIYNTLDDGADGLVLAAETAIGSYPIECVTMVSRIIKQFMDSSRKVTLPILKIKDYFLLPEPHGGVLIDRFNDNFNAGEAHKYKKISVDIKALMDSEQIALGVFSPIEGFMTRKEVDSVIHGYRLPSGIVWPLPIMLQVDKKTAHNLKVGEKVSLVLEGGNDVYAILDLEDTYTYDLDEIAKNVFNTNCQKHPSALLLKKRDNYFLGGKIELLKRMPAKDKYYEITPRETRTIFEKKGWSRVVAFHTRNVIHRVHEYIQMQAFKDYHCDGLFIHPAIGPKRSGDYNSGMLLKSYEIMVNKFYPPGKVVLGGFQSYSRYAGPREAVFTALCRKNFGCSHFIVGRDHTGVGNYYKHNAAHELFEKLREDIGIIPVFFNAIHYCSRCKAYVEKCRHGKKYIMNISGSEAREMLKSRRSPPEWFGMRYFITGAYFNEII